MPLIQASVHNETERHHITIPIDIIKRKGWKAGQTLFFSLNDRDVVELKE